MKNKYRTVKVVTGAVRLVNANIWSPVEVPGRGSIYTATILIPKDDSKTLLGIRTAVDSAAAAGIADLGGHRGKKPKRYLPPYDGDADGLPPVFRGCWYVNAASLTAPQILDHQLYPVADRSTVGSGSWVRVSLAFFLVYKKGGSRISLIENAAHLGLPIPAKLKAVLEQLHDRAEKDGENDEQAE